MTAEMSGPIPQVVRASAGIGRHQVAAVALATGAGITVSLTGGEWPHVGAVGLGVPRPSRREPERTSASSSVLTVTGHRDDALAKPLAELVASRLGQVAVLVVGLHVDDATPEDISRLTENARQALERLLARLEEAQGTGTT